MTHFRLFLTLFALPALLAACISGPAERLAANTNPDDESGLGGTGIIGAITGFGSIFVNGEEVDIDRHTRLSVDGQPVDNYSFARGDVVEILATGSERLRARRLTVRHEVIGAVQQLDAGQFRVLGQTVIQAPGAAYTPRPGERVSVSGFRDARGRIHATRVAPANGAAPLISGELRRDDNGVLRIGGQRISVPDNTRIAAGRFVRVSGTLARGILHASRATPLDANPFRKAVRRLLVQGFLHKASSGEGYRIDRIPFTPTATGAGLDLSGAGARPLRIEMQGSAGGRNWTAVRVLNDAGLPRGSKTPTPHSAPRWRSPGMSPMPGGMGGMGGRHGR